MSLDDYLFGEHGYMGGVAIKTSPVARKWRPGRRSTEIKRQKALKAASNAAVVDFFAQARARLKKAGTTALTPTPTRRGPGSVALTPSAPPRPAPPPRGIFTGTVTPQPRSGHGMMGLLGIIGAQFFDGMGDTTIFGTNVPGSGSSGSSGSSGVDPVTGLPLPPGWTVAPDGTLVPPTDPAPPTNPNGTPYTGNSQVWVSQTPVQMFWDPRAAVRDTTQVDASGFASRTKPYQLPVLYPDGAPVSGQLWLPKMNLEQLNGQVFKPFVRAAVVFPRGTQQSIYWPRNDGVDYFYADMNNYPGGGELPGYLWQGTHSIEGNLYQRVMAGQAAAPWGPVEPWGPGAQIENHKGGGDATVWYMQASFDWSGLDPTSRAYPFLYDWLTDEMLHWQTMPADLWLSTGAPVTAAMSSGNVYLPYQPSALLHNLDFLDSLATGNHGMPQVLHWDTGTMDFQSLAAWAAGQGDKNWSAFADIIGQAATRPFLVATIYDVTEVQVSPGTNATQPVPPASGPSTGDTGVPLPIGGGFPLDLSGQPYNPTTGLLVDPKTGVDIPGAYANLGAGAPGYPGGYPNTGPLPPGVTDYGQTGDYGDYGGYDYGQPQFVPNDGGQLVDTGGGYGYGYPPAPPDYGYGPGVLPPDYGYGPGVLPPQLPQLQPLAPVMPPYVDQGEYGMVSAFPPMDDYQAQDLVDFGQNIEDPYADEGDY